MKKDLGEQERTLDTKNNNRIMRNLTLSPEHILRAGGDGGIVEILDEYLAKYKSRRSHEIPPVFVVVNELAVIRETIESKQRERIVKEQEEIVLRLRLPKWHLFTPRSTLEKIVYLSEFQPVATIIPISRAPNSEHHMGLKFSEVIMKHFDYAGSWDDFIKKYNEGYFHPLYIHPDVLRYEEETDIVETCTKDNIRLTYSEVLTRQQYEEKRSLLCEEQERDLTAEVEREFYRYSDVEKLIREYLSRGVGYLLVDGNHRALAAALSGNPVSSLVLDSDGDVQEAISMAESGKIKDFHQRWQTLKELKMSLYYFYAGNIDFVSTVQELADSLKEE